MKNILILHQGLYCHAYWTLALEKILIHVESNLIKWIVDCSALEGQLLRDLLTLQSACKHPPSASFPHMLELAKIYPNLLKPYRLPRCKH
jgi:hypothetical protein